MRWLPARWRRAWAERVRVRPTREGAWLLVLLTGLTAGAFNTGNNLLYLLLALLLALLVLQSLLAEWNLRGLRVERRLPTEAFAFEGAAGALVLVNRRPALAAMAVHLRELDGGEARCVVSLAEAGGRTEAPVTWTFAGRGWQPLGRVRLESTFPFGFFRRYRDFALPEQMLVYPARRQGRPTLGGAGPGREHEDPRRRGEGGDFRGLRPYQPGDPVRRIHWPSTARTGRPMLIERAAEQASRVLVKVPGRPGQLERELSEACGLAVRSLAQGLAVGLETPERALPAGQGEVHRRRLLTALALHGEDDAGV